MACPVQILKFLDTKGKKAVFYPKVLINTQVSNGMTRMYGVSSPQKKELDILDLLRIELEKSKN